jgi:hypothetical protein
VARRKEKRVWRRVESRRGGESLEEEEEEEGAGDVLAPALTNKLGPGERRRRGGWGWGRWRRIRVECPACGERRAGGSVVSVSRRGVG